MSHPVKQRKKVVRRQPNLTTPPQIDDLNGLILMAQSGLTYANIDTKMLWNILPQLIEINEMVGMADLKKTLFHQVIYYLQHLYKGAEYLHTVIMGPPGTGKCLGKDTPVLMYHGGTKLSQDIIPGDLLMGDDSTPRTVLTTTKGIEHLYKISQMGKGEDDFYIVNESHIISLVDSNDTFMDIPIKECKKYLNDGWFGYKTSVSFPKQDISFDPYVVGYVVAMLSTDSNYIAIEKASILYYIKEFHTLTHVSAAIYTVEDDLVELVREHNGCIPFSYKYNDYSIMERVFAGIHDALGIQSTKTTCICVDHQGLTEDVLFLSNVLGLNYSHIKTTYSFQRANAETCYSTLSYLHYAEGVPSLGIMYSPKRRITRHAITITRHTDDGEYYGFELDGNHRFLLGNTTVTHNTTVAKHIGEMYKNMGILSLDGAFKIAKREDFVAEYLGQTAIKTKKLLESCNGGVLFIDEAYALGSGNRDNDSFSKEAIDTLNAYLSEHSDTFCCIIAGYEEEIKNCFFSVNKGLERRFQWIHRVESYTSKDLVEIFFRLVERIGWNTDISPKKMATIIDENKQFFTFFGGDIEALISKCKMAHAKRIFSTQNPEKHLIVESDVIEAVKMIKPNRLDTAKDDYIIRTMYM